MDLDWWDEKVSGLFVTIRINGGGGRGRGGDFSLHSLHNILSIFLIIIIKKINAEADVTYFKIVIVPFMRLHKKINISDRTLCCVSMLSLCYRSGNNK